MVNPAEEAFVPPEADPELHDRALRLSNLNSETIDNFIAETSTSPDAPRDRGRLELQLTPADISDPTQRRLIGEGVLGSLRHRYEAEDVADTGVGKDSEGEWQILRWKGRHKDWPRGFFVEENYAMGEGHPEDMPKVKATLRLDLGISPDKLTSREVQISPEVQQKPRVRRRFFRRRAA